MHVYRFTFNSYFYAYSNIHIASCFIRFSMRMPCAGTSFVRNRTKIPTCRPYARTHTHPSSLHSFPIGVSLVFHRVCFVRCSDFLSFAFECCPHRLLTFFAILMNFLADHIKHIFLHIICLLRATSSCIHLNLISMFLLLVPGFLFVHTPIAVLWLCSFSLFCSLRLVPALLAHSVQPAMVSLSCPRAHWENSCHSIARDWRRAITQLRRFGISRPTITL